MERIPEIIGNASNAEPAAKRLTRRHEAISRHYKTLLAKTLSALGAPDIAYDFLSAAIVAVGYDPPEWVELFDEALAKATLVSIGARGDKEVLTRRDAERRAKQRQRILAWQAKPENPLLFDHNGKFNSQTGKRNALYKFHILELIREIAADVDQYATPKRIDTTIAMHVGEYVARFEGAAKLKLKKQKQTPESNFHRAAAYLKKAIDEAVQAKGDQAAVELAQREFWAEFDDPKYAVFVHFEKIKSLETQVDSGATRGTFVHHYFDENYTPSEPENWPENWPEPTDQAAEPAAEMCPTLSNTCGAHFETPERPTLGEPVADFIIRTWPEKASDQATRLLPNFFSLAELERFDPRANGYGNAERRFCCPSCGGSKPIDAAHRSLSVDMTEGVYFCHRCSAKGKLLERLTDDPIRPARTVPSAKPAAAKPEPKPKDETWRRWLAAAQPIAGTRGADYLTGRGIPTEAATTAGVQAGAWYHDAQRFEGVIFPIRNAAGELIAAQARAIESKTKNTRGPLSQGVFLSDPNALDADIIAVTEAPIDALALAAAGQPAIALCGAHFQDWLVERLSGKRVLIALDADEAGDKAAAELQAALSGRATVERLRPRGAKDWGEMAESFGIAAIEAQLVM